MKITRDTAVPHDYLKYYKVIRQFYKAKYGLTQADFDMLLFLYSENYFDRSKFDEFARVLSWDKWRFKRLVSEGWISTFRKSQGNKRAIYELSDKAVNVIRDLYRKLNGEEIPTSLSQNPLFLKNVSYADQRYRDMIQLMNEFTRQQRHQTPE